MNWSVCMHCAVHIAVDTQRQPWFKLQQYNSYSDLSAINTLSQLFLSVSTPKQPWLTTYLRSSTGKAVLQSIWLISIQKKSWFTIYKHWQSSFTINSISFNSKTTSIHYLRALAKHFHNRFNQPQLQSNLNSLPTLTQALAKQLHNQFNQYQLQSNLDSLPTSTQSLAKQFHNWFDQHQLQSNLESLPTSTGKAVSQSTQ